MAAAAAAATAVGALVWGTLIERKMFTLREVSVPVLPSGSAPIRVLHLSDLHMAPWQGDKQDWVRGLAALHPDLVVVTGDNLGHERGIEGIEIAFAGFQDVPGVYVHGSNDYWGPTPKNPLAYFGGPSGVYKNPARLDTDALEQFFDDLGWVSLNNTAAALDIAGTHIEFFGVDDPHRDYDRLDLMAGAIDELRANDPLADTESWPDPEVPDAARPTLSIGVVHAPYQRVLNALVTQGAEMIFAGHTHGGQVCVPGFGALVTNCDIPRRQVKGLSRWAHGLRSAWLNVSAGLGTSIYAPVRFACRPEATLLTLVPIE